MDKKFPHWALTGVLLGILVITVIVLLFGAYQGLFQLTFITAIANSVLVLVTGVYAALTYLLVRETRRARRQEIMPVFTAGIDPLPGREVKYHVVLLNIGNGPAQDLEATLELVPDGARGSIQSLNVVPGGKIGAHDPFDSIEVLPEQLKPYEELRIRGCYKDLFGNSHDFSLVLDLKDFTEGEVPSTFLQTDPITGSLNAIGNEVGRIADEIGSGGVRYR